MSNCPQCGTPVMPGTAFCDNCGASIMAGGGAPPPPAAAGWASNLPPTTAVGGGCPQCGTPVIPGEAFCGNCGAALNAGTPPGVPVAPPRPPATPPPAGKVCPGCGTPAAPGALFCDNCGTSLSGGAAPPPAPPQPYAPPPQQQQIPQPPPAPTPTMGGQTCPQCGAAITPGAAFCDNCGSSLAGAAGPPPAHPVTPPAGPAVYQPPYGQQPPAAGPVGPAPRLVIQSTGAALPFPAGKAEIIAGREDPVSNVFPEVDLDPHGGDEGGVSRRHAKFTLQGNQWYLQDLNSTNFTFVNKQKLQPNQFHPVNNGDEVRLGRVIMNFYTGG